MELARAAERLAGAHGAGTFPVMVDDDDGEAVATLQLAQECEERGHLAADVLVDAMQADEGVEDEEPRPAWRWSRRGGPGRRRIEPERRCGDHLDVEFGDGETGGGADSVEAPTDDVERIFGGVEQDASGPGYGEAAQAGGSGGDGDGQIEGKEGFAAFWLAADDADGLLGPQAGDEPALVDGVIGEAMGGLERATPRRRPISRALTPSW